MVAKTYSEKLLDHRWQKKRLEVMSRDNFKCRICDGTDKTLHVHHLTYSKEPWDASLNQLLTLCDLCHKKIHSLGKIEIGESGFLDPIDFILLDPIMIINGLCYISDHEGIWEVEFRETATSYSIIRIICLLYRFITPTDCDINVRFNITAPSVLGYKTETYKVSSDVYRWLNELTIPIS